MIRAILFFVFYTGVSLAQQIPVNPVLLKGSWPAFWISCPDVPQREYGVFHFRKTFNLESKPEKFIIHVSADNRYRLFVNGKSVCSGPARGDLYNWYFETLDIASYLRSGNNAVTATVWNMGTEAPVAQITNQTAFVLQGDSDSEKILNTGKGWKVIKDLSYTACSTDNGARLGAYMVIGPGDQVDAKNYPWGWEKPNYNDHEWPDARQLVHPALFGYGTNNAWTLVPRNIPLMEEHVQRIVQVRRATGIKVLNGFLAGNQPLTIAANTTVSILLDQTHNTVAYPELVVSGGKDAVIKMTYAEALYGNENKQKGNRNAVEGKTIKGNYDIFLPDGEQNRMFRPLWIRTYRYLQLDITTKDQPLVINDIYGMYTGYPFKEEAKFTSNDLSLQKIWDISWRTARLCAGETYFDCPYYEQLQYPGDTRIQALISLYVSGDDRLMRKAIIDFYNSRVPEGLTQGRYPSNRLQVIPPYSLCWISMVYDYWMHRKDDKFTGQFLTGIRGVMDWYEKQIDAGKQMLGPMKWWNFVDYTTVFPSGVPDGAAEGNSSVITLQYVYTLQQAAALFEYFGKKPEAENYRRLAETLGKSTYQHCFDKNKQEMANTPDKKVFSQHAGIMGVLTGVIPDKDVKEVMQNVLTDSTMGPVTFYWRFYLTQALKKANMAHLYYSQLTPWRNMLDLGLTTFAEKPEPARSDCHAWSASPNYDFLATICGIMPDSPGFETVLIKPALGELNEVNGTMPHPDGKITVSLKRKNNSHGIQGEVNLPATVNGRFIWNDTVIKLHGGRQSINL